MMSLASSSDRPGLKRDEETALIAPALVKRYGKGTDSDATDAMVVTSITLASDPISLEDCAMPSTRRNGDPGVVQSGAMVRRLTPTECERLQGLPDGWTRLDPKTPDSRRYAALGDAVTANVAEWIGRRLVAA